MQMIATDASPKLSTPSKMKGTCKTWSTLAITHCPASRGDDGKLVDACSNCYADKNFYKMPAAVNLRNHNAQDWRNDGWVDAMIELIGEDSHFRFFDSGDMYHINLAHKIYDLCKALPNTRFWIPTRMHKLDKFKPILAKLAKLENVVVRKSSDSTQGKRIRGATTSIIIRTDSQAGNAHICPATIAGNKPNCKANNCTACWSKSVPVVAYHYH
jgi:hypothetical protein